METFFARNKRTMSLLLGYVIVLALGFGLGQTVTLYPQRQTAHVSQATTTDSVLNHTTPAPIPQLTPTTTPAQVVVGAEISVILPVAGDCFGKIKGNISGASRVYHVVGQTSYKSVQAELCFKTEKDALTAGFRKSQR